VTGRWTLLGQTDDGSECHQGSLGGRQRLGAMGVALANQHTRQSRHRNFGAVHPFQPCSGPDVHRGVFVTFCASIAKAFASRRMPLGTAYLRYEIQECNLHSLVLCAIFCFRAGCDTSVVAFRLDGMAAMREKK
jgi:hypothetical protein